MEPFEYEESVVMHVGIDKVSLSSVARRKGEGLVFLRRPWLNSWVAVPACLILVAFSGVVPQGAALPIDPNTPRVTYHGDPCPIVQVDPNMYVTDVNVGPLPVGVRGINVLAGDTLSVVLQYFYCNRFILSRREEAGAGTGPCGCASGRFATVRCGRAPG
jgi:hypothetical protein